MVSFLVCLMTAWLLYASTCLIKCTSTNKNVVHTFLIEHLTLTQTSHYKDHNLKVCISLCVLRNIKPINKQQVLQGINRS